MKNYFYRLILLLFCLCLQPSSVYSQDADIHLVGGSRSERDTISSITGKIMDVCYDHYYRERSLNSIRHYFRPSVFNRFSDHIEQKYFYPEIHNYSGILITNLRQQYEVHGLNMKLTRPEKDALIPHKHINFILGKDFMIEDFYFAPEKHHYQDVLQFGKPVTNPGIIRRVDEILHELKVGYIKKESGSISHLFSDDILMITGFIPAPDHPDTLTRFIHYTKEEYLQKLDNLFTYNNEIRIEFNEVKIKSHPFAHKVFGIQLRQIWGSDYYEDAGYLFLMIDFFDEKRPLIHVRIWQPEAFE